MASLRQTLCYSSEMKFPAGCLLTASCWYLHIASASCMPHPLAALRSSVAPFNTIQYKRSECFNNSKWLFAAASAPSVGWLKVSTGVASNFQHAQQQHGKGTRKAMTPLFRASQHTHKSTVAHSHSHTHTPTLTVCCDKILIALPYVCIFDAIANFKVCSCPTVRKSSLVWGAAWSLKTKYEFN